VNEYHGFESRGELQASVNKVQSRILGRRLALVATLIAICGCTAACSGLGPAGTPGQREYASRQYAALRQDQVFDLHVPGGLPGLTVTAPGAPADSDHPGEPNQGGRTWKVKHPSPGLLTVLIQEMKAHGVAFDSAGCGRNLILHGLQYLGPGTAGVFLTLTPYPVSPTSALTVQVEVDAETPNAVPDPLTQDSKPVLPPTSNTPHLDSLCSAPTADEIAAAYP
jgi:hypothetical protein